MMQEPAPPPRGEGIGQGALESACFLILWSRLLQDGGLHTQRWPFALASNFFYFPKVPVTERFLEESGFLGLK